MDVVGIAGALKTRGMVCGRVSRLALFGVPALLFAASAAATIAWCSAVSTMAGMPMRGGWTLSMAWTRTPGQTWASAAALFLGMWVVMMVAMMLPSLAPTLLGYRRAVELAGATQPGRLATLVALGYFTVWTGFGAAAFPIGAALAALKMRLPALAQAAPTASGMVVLAAGALQFSAWKGRHLACCRGLARPEGILPADAGTAWQWGLRLGFHCGCCCAGLIAVLLVTGVMDLGLMAVVTAATTLERLAPGGERATRAIGGATVGAGLLLVARVSGLG